MTVFKIICGDLYMLNIGVKIRRKVVEYKEFCGICNIMPKEEHLRYKYAHLI